MDEKRIMDILQKVADQNGVPLTTVLEEIERVIDGGMESPDPQIRMRWQQIPCRGRKPSVSELMVYLVNRAAGRLWFPNLES